MTIASLADIDAFVARIAAGEFTQAEIDCIVDATNMQPLREEAQALGAELLALARGALPVDGLSEMAEEDVASAVYEVENSSLESIFGMDAPTCSADPTCSFLMADDGAELREAVVGEYNKIHAAAQAVIKVHNQSVEFYDWGAAQVAAPTDGVEGKLLLRLLKLKSDQSVILKELNASIVQSEAKLNAAIVKTNAAHAKIVEADGLTGDAKKAKLAEASAATKEAAALVGAAKGMTDAQKQIRIRFNTIPAPIIP